MGQKIYLTETELQNIIEDATLEVLNENQQNVKEKLNEWNSYKVNFDSLGAPKNKPRAGIGGNYWDNKKTKELLSNGTYGGTDRMVDMSSFIYDMEDLGYTREQIQRGIENGSIQLRDRYGNPFNTRRQNRKLARLMTNAGGILGTGAAIGNQQQQQGQKLLKPEEMGVAPAPVVKTVYYKSDSIRQIQQILNDKFGANLATDGQCGNLTATAILNALKQVGGQSKQSSGIEKQTQSEPKRPEIEALPKVDDSAIRRQAVTAATPSMPRPQETGATADAKRNMSAIYNDPAKTSREKEDLTNRLVQNAGKSGIHTKDQMKNLRDRAKTYKQAAE